MIDRTFLEKIEEMAEPKIHEVDGIKYARRALARIAPPVAEALTLHTLTGIRDYLEVNEFDSAICHVAGPDCVRLFSALDPIHRNREQYIEARPVLTPFVFERFMPVEEFIIRLQSLFVQDDTTAAILRLVGSIEDGTIRQTADDGITQTVNVKTGIARVGEQAVPNRVVLTPYRTFPEITQPASQFLLRLKSGPQGQSPQVALFESDGGAWKLAAIQAVADWCGHALSDKVQIIA